MAKRAPVRPAAGEGAFLVVATGLGALGLLPAAPGAADPVALLAWLALLAPAAGAYGGARGWRLVPFGCAPPALWAFFLVWADLGSPRDLPTPLWALVAVAGLWAAGHAAGSAVRADPAACAGVVLLLGLLASGLGFQGAVARPEANWGRTAPRVASLLLDLSPWALVLDCAGWDWTHSNPSVYAASGVEWVPRRPYRGRLAGPAVLVVGCAAAGLSGRRARRRASTSEAG